MMAQPAHPARPGIGVAFVPFCGRMFSLDRCLDWTLSLRCPQALRTLATRADEYVTSSS
jgi:hypothetical protein